MLFTARTASAAAGDHSDAVLRRVIRNRTQKRDRLGGDSFPGPGKSKTFLRRRFHAHLIRLDSQRIRNIFRHLRTVRQKFWSLRDHRGIDILDQISVFLQDLSDFF